MIKWYALHKKTTLDNSAGYVPAELSMDNSANFGQFSGLQTGCTVLPLEGGSLSVIHTALCRVTCVNAPSISRTKTTPFKIERRSNPCLLSLHLELQLLYLRRVRQFKSSETKFIRALFVLFFRRENHTICT
jgi:hypothetical protein